MAPSPAESRPADSTEELSAAFLERLRVEPLRELTVLDAGTGSGRLALALAPLCRAVVGVDRDGKAIDEARRRAAAAKLSNVRFVVGDIEVEEYAPFKPDLVVAYLCMSDAIAEPLSCTTRPQAAGASLTEIASSEIALAETLLNLTNGRALTDIASTALAVVCHARVVAKPAAKAWIVYPSVSVA